MRQSLQSFGYSSAYIKGSLSREGKVEQVEAFRNEHTSLISTDAGGEGINLQFCYCMINFDLPWNPARLEQRIGRVDRIGQEFDVLIFNFHLKNTVEDRVRGILESKLKIIKEQFGEDKYADVISVLQEEFSFDRIYTDGLAIKEKESKSLESQAKQIFDRAQEIIQSEELLIPFADDSEAPEELLNTHCNQLIESMVRHYLESQNIETHSYKENPNLCYFENPFKTHNTESTLRHVAFDYRHAQDNERVTFINVEHPIVNLIRHEFRNGETGLCSAFRLKINKFQGISGYWFVYRLSIRNNLDRNHISTLSAFMEDEEFSNQRIANFLNQSFVESYEELTEFDLPPKFGDYQKAAYEEIKLQANDTYSSKKMDWLREIEAYQERADNYYQYKRNLISNIGVDNIRRSRMQKLTKEQETEMNLLERKKLIVPKIELLQTAYVEFI